MNGYTIMTKYKHQHRLNKEYNKVCSICNKSFYTKDLRLIYCSESCREKGRNINQKKNHQDWYKKNKERILKQLRIKYAKKHPIIQRTRKPNK